MRTYLLVILVLLLSCNILAQEKKLSLKLNFTPTVCQSYTQQAVYKDGQPTLTNKNKSIGLFFGGGLEILRSLKNNWFIAGDFSFVSKGFFAKRDSIYNNGSFGGTNFTRNNINFLEPSLSIEKQFLAKNSENRFTIAAGLFYGFHLPNIVGFALKTNGNDFGSSISAGFQKKKLSLKLDYKKGFINIDNNVNASFKTNILCLKLGYVVI